MEKNDETNQGQNQKHHNPLPHEITEQEKEITRNAHLQADKDISSDAELSAHSPNDDLDEGETARLGEKTDII